MWTERKLALVLLDSGVRKAIPHHGRTLMKQIQALANRVLMAITALLVNLLYFCHRINFHKESGQSKCYSFGRVKD